MPVERQTEDATNARVLEFLQKIGHRRAGGHGRLLSDPGARRDARPMRGDAQWRRGIYDRARQMLVTQLLARRPATPPDEIAAEQSALDAAIARIEAEMSWTDRGAAVATHRATNERYRRSVGDRAGARAAADAVAAQRHLVARGRHRRRGVGAGGSMFWVQHAAQSVASAGQKPTSATAPQAPPAAKTATPKLATTKDGDLAPGIDGGSTDPDLPYVFRRQPTFYRTLQPVGTIIIDKLQHFLYLIQPNNVALRYGIGLGEQCTELAGLRHVASKAEWPPWQATPDMIERKLAKPGTCPAAPAIRSARACWSSTTASPASTAPMRRRPSAPL